MKKITDKNILIDKYTGSLVAGASGDSLGYAVEFLDEYEIYARYGKSGITSFDLENDKGIISDDTQMTMFTANGILNAYAILNLKKESFDNDTYVNNIYLSYLDWLNTQIGKYDDYISHNKINSFIMNYKSLHASRAPGMTCMSALRSTLMGKMDKPLNNSKGCGGVMRVAPIGLFAPSDDINKTDLLGAQAAAITHGHSLGFIPASALVHIVYLLSHYEISILEAVLDSQKKMIELFKDDKNIDKYIKIIDKAVKLSQSDVPVIEAIHALGEGWVAEEALAIAIYSCLKASDDAPDNIERVLRYAVNHNGDSDSTGAIAGNIIGASLGYSKIPSKFIEKLELKDEIYDLALDLFKAKYDHDYLSTPEWSQKYIYKRKVEE